MDLQTEINNAKYVVFMTGAGVSTPSGIPDYRSKNGLYTSSEELTPEYILSHDNLVNNPDGFYDFVIKNMYFPDAIPNVIHEKMVEITNQKGMVITQNVDCLHSKAGTKNLVEFHGNLYDIHCKKCGEEVDYHEYLTDYHHKKDGGLLRSSTVLYGENISPRALKESVEAITKADLIVIVGTSFKVYPFANLLQYRTTDTKVIAINKEDIEPEDGVEMIVSDAVDIFSKLK
ncbi:NAD-dependent protein deacylase [Companilactobacillus sp. RD055328]|uniref:NAD-dependent protein deacylase n=1 Tax=Companilactobacillus sp. RD055328 TaxID=2916634 RepID=UPI001FC8495D|nr:NAD-dependent protein deacylase [Companilactobacillus sp. RD055328]GKQ42326.1 NAD-dependent protein deacylase [Companilactobacillus sp. RD055328]